MLNAYKEKRRIEKGKGQIKRQKKKIKKIRLLTIAKNVTNRLKQKCMGTTKLSNKK